MSRHLHETLTWLDRMDQANSPSAAPVSPTEHAALTTLSNLCRTHGLQASTTQLLAAVRSTTRLPTTPTADRSLPEHLTWGDAFRISPIFIALGCVCFLLAHWAAAQDLLRYAIIA